MGRPLKDPRLRMNTDVRVPVTDEQKQLLLDATADEPAGLAAWARMVLLEAASRKVAKREGNQLGSKKKK